MLAYTVEKTFSLFHFHFIYFTISLMLAEIKIFNFKMIFFKQLTTNQLLNLL